MKYFEWLAKYIQNWARGAYMDFEGEEDIELDAVDVTTVHQAKGLEWPIVFVPSLTAKRFPSSMTGARRDWMVSEALFDRRRYEGSVNDERRLFYVAVTRARDYLSLSTFDFIQKAQSPSPFLTDVAATVKRRNMLPAPPAPQQGADGEEVLDITFSDLSAFQECGLSYRYRRLLGFQPPIVPELGYGKAVHHVLRHVAEFVREKGRTPNAKQLDAIFDREFYLPAATVVAHRQMRQRARKLVDAYLAEWESDLHNTWAVERPFELHLGDATVSGRADVIIRDGDNGIESLAIVDYKTAADGHTSHDFQLQVYTDAGRREGLDVAAAYVHDLKNTKRLTVDVGDAAIEGAEARVGGLIIDLRAKDYSPRPGEVCMYCDVRLLCAHRAET
jgi:DNA helicase-2/ATP-dependent DNA helicase PcrA